jgi:hypothetical protein
MSIQTVLSHLLAAATTSVFAALALPTQGLAQPLAAGTLNAGEGIAWLGCWKATGAGADAPAKASVSQHEVCVELADDSRSLELTARQAGEIVAEQALVIDGLKRQTNERECQGWSRGLVSRDGRRLYLQSETSCLDGSRRSLSGVSMLVSPEHWVDIQGMQIDRERSLAIRHYRLQGSELIELPGAAPSSRQIARIRAAADLTIDDVMEALELVDSPVVEAMLLERRARFAIDGQVLLRLRDKQVSENVIDLMVALSFPEYFVIQGKTITRRPQVRYATHYSPWYRHYGYGYGTWHGFWPGYYPPYFPYPPVVVPPPSGNGGKVISGRGYTQVRRSGMPSGVLATFRAAGNGGGGSAGYSGASSSTASSSSGGGGGSSGSSQGSGYHNSGGGSGSGGSRRATSK